MDRKLYELQGDFCKAMLDRLSTCEAAGFSGWDIESNIDAFKARLAKNFVSGSMVDVANLAMIIWYHEQRRHLNQQTYGKSN